MLTLFPSENKDITTNNIVKELKLKLYAGQMQTVKNKYYFKVLLLTWYSNNVWGAVGTPNIYLKYMDLGVCK